MTTTPATPCQGETGHWWTSEHRAERRQAAALCHGCPLAAACHAEATSRRPAHGVWAGRDYSRTSQPLPAEPKPVDSLRDAHAAYARGDRDPGTVDLERAYQRNRKRATRARPAREAAA